MTPDELAVAAPDLYIEIEDNYGQTGVTAVVEYWDQIFHCATKLRSEQKDRDVQRLIDEGHLNGP